MQPLLQLTRALADETRLQLLTVLLEGDATVSDLVTRLGIPQPRVSMHLAVLRRAALVSMSTVGRQRVYRLRGAQVKVILDALHQFVSDGPRRSLQAAREVRRNTALRQARTCYDHLAGVAGVRLLDEMLQRQWVEKADDTHATRLHYRLTPQGIRALEDRGVDVTRARRSRRRLAYGCLDWTERRAHLGGALGAAILEAMSSVGIMQRQPNARVVALRHPVLDWIDGPVA